MPVIHELFGKRVTHSGCHRGELPQAACPFMDGRICDGGGNRDMARWPASHQPLAPFFEDEVRRKSNGFIPCGACSVATSEKEWAICSRRLLTFRGRSKHQEELRHAIASVSGFSAGDQVKVWSEITIRHESTHINYRLDYVLATAAKPPVIVEIMTASTSGGNKERRTDIKNAFCDCVLYSQGLLQSQPQSPGVNVRQVWVRMASQLIVKSQLANAWGGRAIWVVQDALMDYIRHNAGLRLDDLHSPDWTPGEVNVIASGIGSQPSITMYSGPVLSADGSACWAELLNAPNIASLSTLTGKIVAGKEIAEFTAT